MMMMMMMMMMIGGKKLSFQKAAGFVQPF